MSISRAMITQLEEFFDGGIDYEWIAQHTEVKCDDATKTITIIIDNVNEQHYDWVKEEL